MRIICIYLILKKKKKSLFEIVEHEFVNYIDHYDGFRANLLLDRFMNIYRLMRTLMDDVHLSTARHIHCELYTPAIWSAGGVHKQQR